MSELTYGESLAFSSKLTAMAAEREVIEAIRDTWRFMTGDVMPECAIVDARTRSIGQQAISLWDMKLSMQAAADHNLDDYALKTFRSYNDFVRAEAQMDIANNSRMPTADPFFTELITSLGSRILDSAYRCLGKDIDELVEETKQKISLHDDWSDVIDTLHEQFKKGLELLKLDDDKIDPADDEDHKLTAAVLQKVVNELRLKDDTGRQLNHILKLSPETIGVAPYNSFNPSCLAISIIAASFFRQCGVETMLHCGVMVSADTRYSHVLHDTVQSIEEQIVNHGQPITDTFHQYLRSAAKKSRKTLIDYDPHAAILIKVGSEWVMYDPYGGQIVAIDGKKNSKILDNSKEILDQFNGLEWATFLQSEAYHLKNSEAMRTVFFIIQKYLPDIKRWGKALDSSIVYLDDTPLLDLLNRVTSNDDFEFAELLAYGHFFDFDAFRAIDAHPDDEEGIKKAKAEVNAIKEKTIKDSLAGHVFGLKEYDKDKILKALRRCDEDDRYRERCTQDLAVWPYKLFLRCLQNYRGEMNGDTDCANYGIAHHSIELGHLEHRIGAMCLLDVSYGLGHELPLSYWARQSSSQLPFLYYSLTGRDKTEKSAAETELYERIQEILQIDSSLYSQLHSII